MIDKRGMSTAIKILLAICLVMIIIIIVLSIVKKEDTSLDKLTLILKIEEVQVINENTFGLKIVIDSGEGKISGIKFLINNGGQSEIITRNATLNEFDDEFILELQDIELNENTKISASPIFELKSGETIAGKSGEAYEISEEYSNFINKNNTSCTDTCSSLHYSCGTRTICGNITNCGNCLTEYTCQTNGTCTKDTCIATNCTALGRSCGNVSNGCNETLNCGNCQSGYTCQTNGTCIRKMEIIRCNNLETNIDPNSSLNIFFVGSGYGSNQLFCKDKCNLTDFSKILENDIYRLLYNNNKTQGFGLLTIEPFKPNMDKVNIYMLTSPINCDYEVDRYCFFNFKEQVANSCPAYNYKDYIYVIIGYDDSKSFGLGGGSLYYSVSHRKGQHKFEDTVSVFIHEFGHSLGLHDLYGDAYQAWEPQIMANSSSIPNCDNTPGCPKWCKGEALPPFETVCSKFLNKEDCIAHSTESDCLWFEEEEPYFKTKCVRNYDFENHDIGTECMNGTGCYWGCATAGYRPASSNNFANRFSQRIDSLGKAHTYEPVSEKFVKDILDCCYPQSCTQYDYNYCTNFSRTYPQYGECYTC